VPFHGIVNVPFEVKAAEGPNEAVLLLVAIMLVKPEAPL
jgi:hypothetical protein